MSLPVDPENAGIVIPEDPEGMLRLADHMDPNGRKLGESPVSRLQRLMNTPEKLHPDLVPYRYEDERFGQQIKHPLVFSIAHADFQNAMVNEQYRAKKKYVAECMAKGNYEGAVWMHERPYRLEAFMDVEELLTDTRYWRLLGELWTDSENIWQNGQLWQDVIFESERTRKWEFMDKDERDALRKLRKAKKPLMIYRGYCHSGSAEGMSWTLDHARAEWFAKRFASLDHADTCEVIRGVIDPKDVFAHKLGRDEAEIVASSDYINVIRVDVL